MPCAAKPVGFRAREAQKAARGKYATASGGVFVEALRYANRRPPNIIIMSRPVTLAETKTGDAALSIDPSGAGTKRAPAAEIIQEDLPAMAGPGSAGGSRSRDGRDFSPPSPSLSPSPGRASLAAGSCDGPSDWNGVARREKEAEGDVLATPVPVPAHQGPPSFAQSEFHTVDILFFSVGPLYRS